MVYAPKEDPVASLSIINLEDLSTQDLMNVLRRIISFSASFFSGEYT
ncbi:MAG: hypothetical protein IPO92_02965 [Saprospiraceae bacterium]|nr:hypothetical protein [Saprospiraceae bacterium]